MASGGAVPSLPQAIASLNDRISNPDADYRYMALNDLTAALQDTSTASYALDARAELSILSAMFKLLADSNSAVKNMAVKCLIPLVPKLSPNAVCELVNKLNGLLDVSESLDESVRDVVLMALRVTFNQISSLHPSQTAFAADLAMASTDALMLALLNEPTDNIKSDIMDAVADLIAQFGPAFSKHSSNCLPFIQSLYPKLLASVQTGPTAMRKRAGLALSHLLPLLTDGLGVVNVLLADLRSSSDPDILRTHLATLTLMIKQPSISFMAGLVPQLIDSFRTVLDKNEELDEAREQAIQALDCLVLRYPTESLDKVMGLVSSALLLVQYDPNYAYDSEEGEDSVMEDAPTEDREEEEDEYAYSDDEDMTWKVRRAASRLLSSIIATYPDLVEQFVPMTGPVLTQRFQEREESVRNEILTTYSTLLRTVTTGPAVQLLHSQRPIFHGRLIRFIVHSKDLSTRIAGFSVLTDALNAFDWSGDTQLSPIWGALLTQAMTAPASKGTSGTSVKLHALQFASAWLQHPLVTPPISSGVVGDLASALVIGMTDGYYKVVAESLTVACLLVPMLVKHELFNNINTIQSHVESILMQASSDEDIKDRALGLFGLIVSTTVLSSQRWEQVLMKRLTNEVSRVPATRVVSTILKSNVVQARPFLDTVMPELVPNLRQNSSPLREATLVALITAIDRFPNESTSAQIQSVLEELSALVSEDNLGLAAHAINLASLILCKYPNLLPLATEAEISTTNNNSRVGIVHCAIALLQSPQIQGAPAFTSLLDLVESTCKAAKLLGKHPSRSMYALLCSIEPLQPSVHAKALAAAAWYGDLDPVSLVANELIPIAVDHQKPSTHRQLALLTVGELGRFWTNIADHSQLLPAIISLFGSDVDSVRAAAAYTLGSLAIGNPRMYLPDIVDGIKSTGAHRALMLLALKQVLTSASHVPDLTETIPQLWADLFSLVSTSLPHPSPLSPHDDQGASAIMEEGARLAVAECIGKLALLDPGSFVFDLHTKLRSPAAEVRVTVMGAFKYILAHGTPQLDSILAPMLADFVCRIGDEEVPVRRAALASVQSAAHSRPELLRPIMDMVVPLVITETQVRPNLIREVIMGPFKHKIDDGLETRKLAYETLSTVLTTLSWNIRPVDVLNPVLEGLSDTHQEVKLLAYMALTKLTSVAPRVVVVRLDELVDVLNSAIFPRTKHDAIKQDVDKQHELIRAALRAVVAMTRAMERQSVSVQALAPKYCVFNAELRMSSVSAEFVAAEQQQALVSVGYTGV